MPPKTKYLVMLGVNYPKPGAKPDEDGVTEEVRQEPGDIVSNIPAEFVQGFLDAGAIVEADPDPVVDTGAIVEDPAADIDGGGN